MTVKKTKAGKAPRTSRLHGIHDPNDRDRIILPDLRGLDDPASLARTISEDIFSALSDAKREAIKAKHGITSGAPAQMRKLLGFMETPSFSRFFKQTAEFLQDCEYSGDVLLSRTTATEAYRTLLKVIISLGPPLRGESLKAAIKKEPSESLPESPGVACAVLGMRRFMQGLGEAKSVWIAYRHDLHSNRPCYLDSANLSWPEAARGYVWKQNLPAMYMFRKEKSLVHLVRADEILASASSTVGFCEREGVDSDRVVAFQLAWGHSRIVSFVNGTKSDAYGAVSDSEKTRLQVLWSLLLAAREEQDDKKRDQKIAQAISTLELAARYLVGWLSASDSNVAVAGEVRRANVSASYLLGLIGRAVDVDQGRLNVLREAVQRIIADLSDNAEDVQCRIHHTDEQRTEITLQKGKLDSDCYLVEGKFEEEPTFQLEMDPDHYLVAKSISAQAAAWNAPLWIDHGTMPLDSDWARLDVPHVADGKVRENVTQIAIPFDDARIPRGRRLGVVNIESTKPELTDDHMHRAELAVHLYSNLADVWRKIDKMDKDTGTFVRRLLSNPPSSSSRLLRRFCGWCRRTLGAGLARVLIFEPRVRVFHPMGITINRQNACEFIRREYSNLGITENEVDDFLALYKRSTSGDQNKPSGDEGLGAMHALLEYAVSSRFLPRPESNTWELFIGRKTEVLAPDTTDTKVFGDRPRGLGVAETIDPYSRSALGVPFSRAEQHYAEGVFWVSWRDKKNKTFMTRGLRKIRPVLQVVAGIYSLYRSLDPIEASTALPLALWKVSPEVESEEQQA